LSVIFLPLSIVTGGKHWQKHGPKKDL
jgi:hypothetical protein